MTNYRNKLLLFLLAAIILILVIFLVIIITNKKENTMNISTTVALVDNDKVHLIEHDGLHVAYDNGFPIPSFSTWKLDEESRKYISLNGEWKFAHEADISCSDSEQACSDKEYDDSSWSVQSVPASLDLSYDDRKYQYKFGSFWFRKSFRVEQDWDNMFVKLNALGMGYHSNLYINGTKIGSNEGGMTAFSFNITPYLNYGGDNVIAVEIIRPAHDSSDNGALPEGGFDWWDYSGITRDIYLEATLPVSISKVIVDASPLKKQLQAYAVLLNYSASEQTIDLEVNPGIEQVSPQSKKVTLQPDQVKVVTYEFDTPAIEAWTTENPTLYTLVANINQGDQLKTSYGAVDIEINGTQILVNGQQEWFKGTNWHDENKESGRSLSPAEYRAEIDLAKNANANLLRNSHYNRHPYAYEYTDEIGLYVMDEIENYWLSEQAIGHQLYEKGLSREKAIAMAWNQINHPSVVFWSVANETTPNNTTHLAWFNDMRDAIRLIDPKKRPVTYASNSQHYPVDMSMSAADVIGLNQYYGFHGGDPTDYGAAEYRRKLYEIHERYPSKPIMLTENGTWSSLGDRARQQWQAGNFAAHWDVTVSAPFTSGYIFWNMKDYRSKMDYTKNDPERLSGMGLVDWSTLAPKVVYYYFQEASLQGANRILNPRFERGTEEWQVINSGSKQGVAVVDEGLQLNLNSADNIQLKQTAFDLLAGQYELELLVISSNAGAIAGSVEIKSPHLPNGGLKLDYDQSGLIKLPFTLTHTGVTNVSVQLKFEAKADNAQMVVEAVNLLPRF